MHRGAVHLGHSPAPVGDSPPPRPPLPRDMVRMRTIATLMLATMTALFAATRFFQGRWPWLAPVRAFAEAAMVGGIADWFAVVALFRHPLGLPIPHTAVIARSHKRIAAAMGRFVASNFLASEAMVRRLEEMDLAGKLGTWLAHPANVDTVVARAVGILPPILEKIGEDRLRAAAGASARRVIDAAITAPRIAGVLSFAVTRGYHQALLDHALEAVRAFLAQNQRFVRARVAAKCGEWMPLWVETKLADGVVAGIAESLAELNSPLHPWRSQFEIGIHSFIDKLATAPDFAERVQAMKHQILDDAAIERQIEPIWAEIHDRLATDGNRLLRRSLEALATRLQTDDDLRGSVNRWLGALAERILVPRREFIGGLISDLAMRWQTDAMVARVETHVGKDLQFIRMNGTIVGGLVGLALYAASALLP